MIVSKQKFEDLGGEFQLAKLAATYLADEGHQVFIVGGAVRDVVSGNVPHDLDLCTSAIPSEVDRILTKAFFKVIPVGRDYGTVSVVGTINKRSYALDISTLRRDLKCDGRGAKVEFTTSLREDLARRDFTINAMAVRLDNWDDFKDNKPIIDYFGGTEDLRNRTIRTVGNPTKRFEEDYLRMIRACRFAGYGLGFAIEPKTWKAISELSSNVVQLSKERIRDELMKMMKTPRPSKCINSLKNTKLLEFVIPPVHKCIGVEQNKHHDETVYEHCVMVCDAVPVERPLLRLVGLLHDIGKPVTLKIIEGEASFHAHEIKGSEIAYSYMKSLRFPDEDCKYSSLLIRHHMWRFVFFDKVESNNTKRSTIKRWLGKLNGLHNDVIALRIADRAGNMAKKDKPLVTSHMRKLLETIKEIETSKEPMKITDLVFSGKDLIEMGHKPGPVFGKVLGYLLNLVLEDPTLNQKETLRGLAKEFLEKN